MKGNIEEPLGLEAVRGGSVGFVADNGPGMLKGKESLSKRMTALLKFKSDTFWDDAHHFQRTTILLNADYSDLILHVYV